MMNEYFEHVGVWRCKVRTEQEKDQQIAITMSYEIGSPSTAACYRL
jgi:hypothetical protein